MGVRRHALRAGGRGQGENRRHLCDPAGFAHPAPTSMPRCTLSSLGASPTQRFLNGGSPWFCCSSACVQVPLPLPRRPLPLAPYLVAAAAWAPPCGRLPTAALRLVVFYCAVSRVAGTGGDGAFRGGDGVVREVEFRCPMTVSVLSERRSTQAYGLAGGSPGARGVNLLLKPSGKVCL